MFCVAPLIRFRFAFAITPQSLWTHHDGAYHPPITATIIIKKIYFFSYSLRLSYWGLTNPNPLNMNIFMLCVYPCSGGRPPAGYSLALIISVIPVPSRARFAALFRCGITVMINSCIKHLCCLVRVAGTSNV